MKHSLTFHLLFPVFSLYFLIHFCSCVEDLIVYNKLPNGDDSIKIDIPDKEKIKINFIADIWTYDTKADDTPIDTGRYATVYAFNQTILSDVVDYYTKKKGTLTPVKNPMYLIIASYNFYAVGVNNPNVAVPTFTDGLCSDLQNNIDYIWWADYAQTPQYPSTNYNVKFRHCCTQVVVNLTVPADITVKDFYSMSLTPSSLDNVTWSLYYGNIGPSGTVSPTFYELSYTQPTDSTYKAQLTMAPIKVTEPTSLKASFKILINDEIYERNYMTDIPVYENDMQAGYSYVYDLKLRVDTILFENVTVADWHIVDVNNVPINP